MKFKLFGKEISITVTDPRVEEPVEQKMSFKNDGTLNPDEVLVAGDKVLVNQQSGFHKGARGVAVFVEPLAQYYQRGQVWVLREHAASPVWFFVYELDKINED